MVRQLENRYGKDVDVQTQQPAAMKGQIWHIL